MIIIHVAMVIKIAKDVPRYKCCKQILGSKGCQQDEQWSCCYNKDPQAIGCMQRYTCCKKENPIKNGQCIDDNINGCKQKYSCCNLNENSKGCKYDEIYDCCNNNKQHSGCKNRYICCKASTDNAGCAEKHIWSCCNKINKNDEGCIAKYLCCDQTLEKGQKKEDIKGCKEYYQCCKGPKDSKGCVFKCCRQSIISKGCKLRCQSCKQEWGTGNGFNGGCVKNVHDLHDYE